jgi:hypothetical protein
MDMREIAQKVPGFPMALTKGRIIASGGLRSDVRMSTWIERDLERVRSLVDRKRWTVKSAALLVAVVDRLADKMRTAEERADAEAVLRADPRNHIRPGKGVTLEGTVIAVKEHCTQRGVVQKMLLADDLTRRFWGTVPASADGDRLNGLRIQVTCNVEPSKQDPIFGIFSRPRNLKVLATTVGTCL